MFNISNAFELGQSLEDATPERCVGCYHPTLLGLHLGQQITRGELTYEEAEDQFVADLETCRWGKVRVIGSLLNEECEQFHSCNDAVIPVQQ